MKSKYTKQMFASEALKYKNRHEFSLKNKAMYTALLRSQMINEVCSHMPENNRINWTIESIKKEALKYNYRKEFELSSSAYRAANRRGILDDVCSHMTYKCLPSPSIEHVKIKALQCKTKSEFVNRFPREYRFCRVNNFIDEICGHMTPLSNSYKRCIYLCLFADNSVYVGLTYNFEKRKAMRLKDPKDAVYKYKLKSGIDYTMSIIEDYMEVKDAIISEKYHIEKYKLLGYNVLNTDKGGGVGSANVKWTEEKIRKTASICINKRELATNYSGAYGAAYRLNILDSLKFKIIEISCNVCGDKFIINKNIDKKQCSFKCYHKIYYEKRNKHRA
jgi:predicted GIY-YIG superfamily endonuclease